MNAGRIAAACLLALVLIAPLGQGGTSSDVLAVLQCLALAAAIAAFRRLPAEEARTPWVLPLVAAFTLWCALGLARVDYLFAGYTTVWDVTILALVLWTAVRVGAALPTVWLQLAVIAGAALESAAALVQHASGGGRGVGTFLSPNHLGAFLGLAAGVAAGRLLACRGRDLLGWVGLGLILPAQLIAVASRGALAALVLVAAGWMIAAARPLLRSGRGRLVALAALVGVAILAALAVGAVQKRFADEDIYRHARLQIWPASLRAWTVHPIAGVGPGMFEHLAGRYNFPRQEGPVRFGRRFHHAHSQYLELLVETGAVGLGLFLASLAALFAGLVRRRRAAPEDPGPIGALLGLAVLALQGIGEPLALVPGVALPAAVLCGRALACRGRLRVRPPLRPATVLLLAGVGAGMLWMTVLAPWLADRHFARMNRAADLPAFQRELGLALRFNPLQPYYYARAAEAILRAVPTLDPASYRICYDYASKAGRLNPVDPQLELLRAEVARRGFEELFRDRASLEETVQLYALAVDLAPTDPIPAASLAAFLLDRGRDGEALQAADRALAIEPNFVRARRMQIEALRRLGRDGEAAVARAGLDALLADLAAYRPENPYERQILDPETVGARRD